jgi:hypothetical protein
MVNEEDNPNRNVLSSPLPVASTEPCLLQRDFVDGLARMQSAQRAVGNTLLVGHPIVIA